MLQRTVYLQAIEEQFQAHAICGILGARQVGKTTLARQFAAKFDHKVVFFDLEDPEHLLTLENPKLVLSQYEGYLIVIDEIQRRPDLFPVLRVLVDHPEKNYKFLILGSASRDLIHQSSETLAGRIGYIYLPPFTFFETHESKIMLLRGGFPKSFLATSDKISWNWRGAYISTFLERDLALLGFDISPQLMHKFWMMLCAYHAQIFNAAELGKSLMIPAKTVRNYLDILQGTFMVRVLQPWFENITKRQVKTPKIYFRDIGIFNRLAGIATADDLIRNPKIGALWEGFALEQMISCLQIPDEDCYFWSTHHEAELDLLVFKNGKRIGFEFKYADAPKITKSMHVALHDLKLDHLYIIFPGSMKFPLSEQITALGFDALEKLVELV
jgi:uncharacterized protein